jgi:hypothetical protein
MEASQMKDAIQALLECPQNNMRVWCNGRTIAIRGDNCDERQNDTATTRFQETLSEILQVSEDNACDVLVDALTAMLQQETLLPQLLRLQQLDIIDGDGAVIIFERLVNVCESEDEARLLAETLPEQGKWPCLFTDSDTTGEKDFEEFFTANETLDMSKFNNLGIIKNEPVFNHDALEIFVQAIEEKKNAKAWAKKEIVSLFHKMIPDFGHKEIGKYLDGKM